MLLLAAQSQLPSLLRVPFPRAFLPRLGILGSPSLLVLGRSCSAAGSRGRKWQQSRWFLLGSEGLCELRELQTDPGAWDTPACAAQ